MRAAVLPLLMFLLPGCEDRRSFDERYADTAGSIHNRANAIDEQLNEANAGQPNMPEDGGGDR